MSRLSLLLPLALLLSACAPPSGQPQTTTEAAGPAPGPAQYDAASVAPPADSPSLGSLSFRIDGGARSGEYGVQLGEDSYVRQNAMGEQVLVSMRLAGDYGSGATLTLGLNAPLSPPLSGRHDISGSLLQVGVLPSGGSSQDARFFTLSAQTGELILEHYEPRQRRARGTFRFASAGGETVEGQFDLGN